jgi:putative ABC transport system ATP-binding protein
MVTHDPELAARASRNIHIMDGQVMVLDEAPRLRDPVAAGGTTPSFA